MKKSLFILCLLPFYVFAGDFTIQTKSKHPAVAFGIDELKTFLDVKNGFNYTPSVSKSDWVITLKQDTSLPECSFAVKSYNKNKKQYIDLTGATEKDIPCAIYTFLEKLGYTFGFRGAVLSSKIDVGEIENYSETIVPVVKFRGIRQHINFPMDLSSYSIADAKEYIRNLARMRFNHIAFHSYPGQWYETHNDGTTKYAGNFFYGDRHDIPQNAFFKKHLHNKKTLCIPEIEPYVDDVTKRSKMAVEWLNEVINESKRVGMQVQYSWEPRSKSVDVQETIRSLQQVYKQYPQIDALEMITEESGGWGPVNTSEETKEILTSFFGKDILNDSIVVTPIQDKQADLGYIYGQIGHTLKTIQEVKKKNIQLPPLKLGIYCTNRFNVPAYYLARKFFPEGEICIMPAHGSNNVAKHTPNILTTDKDWEKTTVYSWIELDGMMYLQQNGIKGIYELMKNRQDKAPQTRFNTIAFNHWRTAENEITARYASISTLYGADTPSTFYKEYARKIGIGKTDIFSNAMELLQQAFDAQTSNIGFAWMGAWRKGFNFHPDKDLDDMLKKYQKTRAEVGKCADGNTSAFGDNTIRFLDNRLRVTLIYLEAFKKANELKHKNITNEKYNEVSNDVLSIFDECMKTYAEMMPDRGCEGTLINLYLCPVRAIKISRQNKTGIPLDEPLKPSSHFDAPAPPIFQGGD